MSTVRVKVTGLVELGRRMRELSDDIQKKVSYQAVAAGARVIKANAISRAPISDQPHQLGAKKGQVVQPGNLRRNIIIKRIPQGQSEHDAEYIVGVRHGKGVAPHDAFYFRFVEFGTVNMPAQPFLRPAFDSQKQVAVNKMKDILRKRIEKAERGK